MGDCSGRIRGNQVNVETDSEPSSSETSSSSESDSDNEDKKKKKKTSKKKQESDKKKAAEWKLKYMAELNKEKQLLPPQQWTQQKVRNGRPRENADGEVWSPVH